MLFGHVRYAIQCTIRWLCLTQSIPVKFHNPTHARAWMRSTMLLPFIMPLCVSLSEIVLKSIKIAGVLL